MDVPQLNTASAYVNNLLLARGLLRDGKQIDFVSLSTGGDKNGKPDRVSKPSITAAETINLVHDLILRRDRDCDRLNSLSETLADLHTSSDAQLVQIDRLKSQNKELHRQLDTSQSSLRATTTTLRASESLAKSLKEESVKTKNALAQVKAQCANDIRKRDVQLQRLKAHLSASQRGNSSRVVPPSCTITQGASQRRVAADVSRCSQNDNGVPLPNSGSTPSLQDAQYSLNQETTEFLTELSQNLSNENDSLVGLIRNTLTTLRQLQNLPPDSSHNESLDDHLPKHEVDDELLHVVPHSVSALSADLEYVLTNLRSILTDASFVSIDEVFSRDEEIDKLREGWDKMESRWHEVVDMLKGWQDRLLRGGATINLEELRLGLDLGQGLKDIRMLPLSPEDNSKTLQQSPISDLPDEESSVIQEKENILPLRTKTQDNMESPNHRKISNTRPNHKQLATPLREGSLNVFRPGQKAASTDKRFEPLQHNLKEGIERASRRNRVLPDTYQIAHNQQQQKQQIGIFPESDDHSAVAPGRSSSASRDASTRDEPRSDVEAAHRKSCLGGEESLYDSPCRKKDVTLRHMSEECEDEEPMTVEQKLKFAESEARRISGTSASPSPVALAKERPTQYSPTLRTEEREESFGLEAQQESEDLSTKPDTPNLDATTKVRGTPAAAAAKKNMTQVEKDNASYAKKTKATQIKETSRKSTRTVTTKVPVKPPAGSESIRSRGRSKATGQNAVREMKEASATGKDLDVNNRRSRRKRKSTLSPEELEELMGLRQNQGT